MISLQGQTLFNSMAGKEAAQSPSRCGEPPDPCPLRLLQEGTHQLVENGRYDTREDFTVVVQPLFEKVDMPKTSVRKASIVDKGEPHRAQAVLTVICVLDAPLTRPLLYAP